MRSRTPDRLCAEAIDLAREAAEEVARPNPVGEHLAAVAEGDRVVTHFFDCAEPGYRGWRWAVTVARASRARVVTVDETVLLPGPEALLPPQWVPWSERLRPGDLGPGDLLPSEPEDLRLEPGYAVEPTEAKAEPAPTGMPEVAEVAEELGMARPRVLSRYGLELAADRWHDAFGPDSPTAQAAPAPCVSCGYLLPMAGALRRGFGVCANEYAPADGRVVSLSFGCGAHSEAAVVPAPPPPPLPVIDEMLIDPLPLDQGEAPA